MIRGSTPTLEFNLPFDVSGVSQLEIIFAQNKRVIVEKDLADCESDGQTLRVMLSRAETLAFSAGRQMEMQLHVIFYDGAEVYSDIITESVERILKEGDI